MPAPLVNPRGLLLVFAGQQFPAYPGFAGL